jgi:hypothetical protein
MRGFAPSHPFSVVKSPLLISFLSHSLCLIFQDHHTSRQNQALIDSGLPASAINLRVIPSDAVVNT